jgi:predicted RNA binding protein YcfA (HicA-like mRNA interferase family)
VITRRELERWLLREGAVKVKRADGHKHFTLRGHHVVVLGHGPQTLSATSVSLVMKQLEQAGYSREKLRREWRGERS